MIASDQVLLYVVIAGFAATEIWRSAGVLLSGGLSEDSAFVSWVRAVSTALVAALISRIVLFPPGALEDVSLALRIGAFGFGIAVFFLVRRQMGVGIFAGTAALIAAHLLIG